MCEASLRGCRSAAFPYTHNCSPFTPATQSLCYDPVSVHFPLQPPLHDFFKFSMAQPCAFTSVPCDLTIVTSLSSILSSYQAISAYVLTSSCLTLSIPVTPYILLRNLISIAVTLFLSTTSILKIVALYIVSIALYATVPSYNIFLAFHFKSSNSLFIPSNTSCFPYSRYLKLYLQLHSPLHSSYHLPWWCASLSYSHRPTGLLQSLHYYALSYVSFTFLPSCPNSSKSVANFSISHQHVILIHKQQLTHTPP